MKRSYASPETSKLIGRIRLGEQRRVNLDLRRGLETPPRQYTRRREGAPRRVGRPRARARVEARQSPRSTSCTRRPATPASPRLGECHPVRAEDGEGLLSLGRGARHRPRRRRPRGAARRRPRRHAAPRRDRRLRPDARGRADRGVEELRQGRDGGGRRADRAALWRSRDRRASSRPTGSPPGRASSSAARRTSSTPACRRCGARRRRSLIEELLEGEEVSLFALSRRRRDAVAARACAGLQADRRRRHGAEHRRHGLVLAGPGLGRRRTSRSSSSRSTGPCSSELARRGMRRSSGCSTPA